MGLAASAKQLTAPGPDLRNRMKYGLAIWLVAFASAADAESILTTGTEIPPGWVNGFIYSPQTQSECQRLFDQIANDEPGKAMLRCMSRVDSRVDPKPPAPTQ